MPPFKFSKYQFVSALTEDGSLGRVFLSERERFPFRDFSDNRSHIVREGDSLFTLAHRFFKGLPRPSGLWWVIADFQPEPIHDPTIQLDLGRVLFVPSVRTVVEEVFSESRVAEATP
jgi:hypothetical protein